MRFAWSRTVAVLFVVAALVMPHVHGDVESTKPGPSQRFSTKWAPFITLAEAHGDEDDHDDDDHDHDSEVGDDDDEGSSDGGNWVRALITSGDILPTGFTFPNIPDGIGAVRRHGGTVDVFVNHELENAAKVSHFRFRDGKASLLRADLAIDGSEGYRRFCSGSAVQRYGFENPVYFANEETNNGIVVAVDATTEALHELPWLGKFAHENTIDVPWFYATARKTVVLSFEDGPPTESEVYMYVANSPRDLLEGRGQLYVFASSDPARNAWDHLYYTSGNLRGRFVPLKWDYRTQDEWDLSREAIAAGAFRFIRVEDGAMDKRHGRNNLLYLADTGSDRDETGALIPLGQNGQTWERGRIYRFEFTNRRDPTQAAIRVWLDGNDPAAPGYGLMSNPDNLDTSRRSLMIQEDRIGVTRSHVTVPYDVTKNAKILRVNLRSGKITVVAYVNQYADLGAEYGNWESSGILDVSSYFGSGTWILTVQAHSLKEGGQLLLLRVRGT